MKNVSSFAYGEVVHLQNGARLVSVELLPGYYLPGAYDVAAE